MPELRSIAGSGITLAVIAGICAALVAATWRLTDERIAANEQALLEQSLAPALGDLDYDRPIGKATAILEPPHSLPGEDAALIYRVYRGSEMVATLFAVTAEEGYSGPIRILVGVRADGAITGIAVLDHRETPGLGDGIDPARSDWAQQFVGRSLGDPAFSGWAIRSDGGDFDQLTGASITPRAVVQAVRDTLLYFDENRGISGAAAAPTEAE